MDASEFWLRCTEDFEARSPANQEQGTINCGTWADHLLRHVFYRTAHPYGMRYVPRDAIILPGVPRLLTNRILNLRTLSDKQAFLWYFFLYKSEFSASFIIKIQTVSLQSPYFLGLWKWRATSMITGHQVILMPTKYFRAFPSRHSRNQKRCPK